jgi:hypothetical protein
MQGQSVITSPPWKQNAKPMLVLIGPEDGGNKRQLRQSGVQFWPLPKYGMPLHYYYYYYYYIYSTKLSSRNFSSSLRAYSVNL